MRLRFDRPLRATSESRANYTFGSNAATNLSFARIRVDPVDNSVVLKPEQALVGGVEYVLRIAAAERDLDRLASFDGTAFAGAAEVRFTTGSAEPTEPPFDDPVDACAAIDLFAGCSGGSACHGGENPALGLSLVSHEAIAATAIGRQALEVQLPPQPAGPGTVSPHFPYGLPLIPAGTNSFGSARSYLFYKILLDPRRAETRAIAAELAGRIPGDPMPPPPFAALTIEQVRTLRTWIDQGGPAPTGPCTSGGDAGPADAPPAETDAAAAETDAATDADGGDT